MGRAMIIICAGVLVSIGYVGFGNSQQLKQVIGSNASYAEEQKAKNAANTVIQMAMREMDLDETWRDNHYSEGTAWVKTVDDSEVHLWVDVIYEETANTFDPDTIQVFSKAYYFDPVSEKQQTKKLINTYLTSAIDEYVPDFKGGLTFATKNVNFTAGGSASISGTDSAGSCMGDEPGVVVPNDSTGAAIKNELDKIDVTGSSKWKTDPKLDYEPTDEMIARLKESGNYTQVSGSYKDAMGTATDPGVFFVEGDAKLSGGIEEGYGILVIRSGGNMEYDSTYVNGDDFSVAGNFTFNGLIVFENAYNFDGKGTPTINGNVLVGHTQEYMDTCLETNTQEQCNIDVDINGNIHMQYDCDGENYAKKAAANAIGYKRYVRISTFE